MKIDSSYRGAINYVTCPITGEMIRFSHVNDTTKTPYVFNYVVENSSLIYTAIDNEENKDTIYKNSNDEYYVLRNNELSIVYLTKNGYIEKPNFLKILIHKLTNINLLNKKIKTINKVEVFDSNIKNNYQPNQNLVDIYKNIDKVDYPHITSIEIGDNIILENKDSKIIIIVRNISGNLLVSKNGIIYDLSEWNVSRKLNI